MLIIYVIPYVVLLPFSLQKELVVFSLTFFVFWNMLGPSQNWKDLSFGFLKMLLA